MISNPNVLVTDRYTTESLSKLKSQLNCTLHRSKSKFPTREEITPSHVLLVRSGTEVKKKLLDWAPNLKVVITSTSGFDHIDLNECENRNIKVMYTPDANPLCAAEVTMMLLLNLSRHMTQCQTAMRRHQWKEHIPKSFELSGKNLGIIGLGRVGSKVARLAQAFNMHISAYDPYVEDQVFEDLQVERLGLSEVFYQCGILSFHVPLTKETFHMVNRATLETMSPGIAILNASRGGIIEETELIEALESGHVGAAALDVFETEPLAQASRFRKLPNVIMTPHIGGYSEEAFQRASHQAVEKAIAFCQNGEISEKLPPKELWYSQQHGR